VAIDFVARGQDLELKGIRKEFPGFVAVDNLDLHIPAGEFFALLGPSGCGKTTTLRMIAGLESPTAGKILLGGKDITDMKPHERPVNTVFQNYALFPHMSVLENVAFGIRRRKLDEPLTKAQQALAMVELEHLAQRKPQQLSGGQQLRRQMQIELKAIQMEVGLTFLHVTHDQEEAMDMADTVAVMNQGRIEQMGAPEALYDRPKTAFVAKFLGQSNMFIGKVTESNAETTSIDFNGKKITGLTKRSEKTSGKIAIGVRPEKTHFHETEPKADPALNILGPGEITDIRFTGVSNQYQIDIPGVGEITVFAQNVGRSPVVELGAKVFVSWKVEHSFGLADLPNGAEETD